MTYRFAVTSGLTVLGLMLTLFGIAVGYAAKIKDDMNDALQRHDAVPHHNGAMSRELILREFGKVENRLERNSDKLDRLINRGC